MIYNVRLRDDSLITIEYGKVRKLNQEIAQERKAREDAEAELSRLRAMMQGVYDNSQNFIKNNDLCPLCKGYEHKKWCLFEHLKNVIDRMHML